MNAPTSLRCYSDRPVLIPLDALVLATIKARRGFFLAGLTPSEIGQRLRLPVSLVTLPLARLCKAGHICRGRRGWVTS